MSKRIVPIMAVSLAIALTLGLSSGNKAEANVKGVCSDCHTMHNSQNGLPMNFPDPITHISSPTPNGVLLRGDCVACHSAIDNVTNIKAGSATSGPNIPIVFNSSGYPATGTLAGGNFYFASTVGLKDTYGHNVLGISNVDTNLNMTPPGFKVNTTKPSLFTASGANWGPQVTTWTNQLTCAGAYGCHGDRSVNSGNTVQDQFTAVRGAHHTNDSAGLTGVTVGLSYRFLAGITGVEENDSSGPDYRWEHTNDSTHHNGYQGDATGTSSSTISYLCGECHGKFHRNAQLGGPTEVGTSSPWLRHPTDIALTSSNGSPFQRDYSVYNSETPVALAVPSTTNPTVDQTSVVMCVSCHRVHGSDQPDLLRFNYNLISAGGGRTDGCLRCHKDQR